VTLGNSSLLSSFRLFCHNDSIILQVLSALLYKVNFLFTRCHFFRQLERFAGTRLQSQTLDCCNVLNSSLGSSCWLFWVLSSSFSNSTYLQTMTETKFLFFPFSFHQPQMNDFNLKINSIRWLNFPHCDGASDGKYVVIQCLPLGGNFSIFLLAIADAN
jgi:hypothetical protein